MVRRTILELMAVCVQDGRSLIINSIIFWSSGAMALGWCTIQNDTYFFSEASAQYGQMMTGWLYLNGNTYYLGEDGAMRRGLVYTDRPGCGHYLNSADKKYYHYFNTN